MKKNRIQWVAGVAAVIIATLVYYGVSSFVPSDLVFAQAGSSADPLVSKSYVDGKFDQLMALFLGGANPGSQTGSSEALNKDAIVAETLAAVELMYGDLIRQAAQSGDGPALPAEESIFVPLKAEKGQILIGLQGSEIILRGGSATVVSGVNGLCDMTEGVDVTNGKAVKLNHLLIVPTSDGRGLVFGSESYLMVRGGYYWIP